MQTSSAFTVQYPPPESRRHGRYMSRGEDRHPHIPTSKVLLFPQYRPGRLHVRRSLDSQSDVTYGDAIIYKAPGTTRFMFQNVKGLTYDQAGEDYNYYLSSMSSFAVDVFGMAETNSCWQHMHLQATFKQCLRRQLQFGKVVFGSPSQHIDPLDGKTYFQAGGAIQVIQGNLTTRVFGSPIVDDTGLGRWCGFNLIGRSEQRLSVITGYRICSGSIGTAPLGSTYHREYTYYKEQGATNPQPRSWFFKDISKVIRGLQDKGNAILLMLDANSDIGSDQKLQEFIASHDLIDLHQDNPAPSTYIGSNTRRIDYMFGCARTMTALSRQGTLSYFEGPQSDHRALYIDLNLSELLGAASTEHALVSAPRRWLRSGNPESVALYTTKMKAYYRDHNMVERIDKLFNNHKDMPTSQVRKLLNQWDSDQGRAMRMAESALSQRPRPYVWSPKLRNAGVLLRYWKLRLREINYSEDYGITFERWERQIQQYDPSFVLPERQAKLDLSSIRRQLNSAHKALKKLQKNASSHRVHSYEELLDKYNSDTNQATQKESERRAKIVSKTIKGEECKQLYTKLRTIVKPSEFSSLCKIEIPRANTSLSTTLPGHVHSVLQMDPEALVWDTIISREDIENHLLQFNREAFRAASASPCGRGVIHDALSFTSLSDDAEDFLYGNTPPAWYGENELLREFLASFHIPETVLASDPIKMEITTDDVIKGFTSWKETTTTSPSGRHLGHYKALLTDPILLKCFCKFLNIAISRGIAPQRWCMAVNVMIEKDPGRPKINRLRIIHLFEADYNLFLKIMWGSRLVQRSVALNLLNDGQHGSVPGRKTMDPVMLNQLTTDLCRVLKVNYARFDNDASACFDRIIVALGMLAARRCGMPVEAVRTHAQALELMRYTVKTVYGVSEEFYTGTPLEPLFGTGQGSGASPAVWLSLVVILLNTLDRVVPDRISFRSADGTIHHERLVDAFVDDTAIGLTDSGTRSLTQLVSALESAAQTWEQLLHYSGGALNLSKCSWYVMYWDWRQGRPQLREISENDPTINLFQQTNTLPKVPIKRLKLSESSRILGVHQTPLGDFSDHITMLKKKADQYSIYLRSPRLTPLDVRVFHRSIYSPAMRYSLPAVAVDEEELDRIQSKVMPVIVQKLGLSSKLPTAVRYGPLAMGGLDLLDLRTECGIEMIKYFRHEVFGGTKVGELLLLQVQASQLESGMSHLILEEPSIHIPYLTPTWILSMRQFMSNHNISITLTNQYKVNLQGRHDKYIMDTARLQRYSTNQQRDLNMVRIYLQVTTLADLVDPSDSFKIAAWALDAHRPVTFVAQSAWPRQENLTASQRRMWRKYISSQFLRYGRFWQTSPRPSLKELKEKLPNLSPPATNFSEARTSLPRHRKRLLAYVRPMVSDVDLWDECQRKQILTIASDGGLKGRQGTFGWVLSTNRNKILAEGAGPIDGPFDTSSSTRSELGGYAASLLFLSLLHTMWGKRHQCNFRWVTDSKSAITNVNRQTSRGVKQSRQPHNSDYLGLIRQETVNLRRTITPVWVKGHQRDSSRSVTRRSHDIQCNNRADELATWYREHPSYRQSVEHTEHTPESRVSISINGLRLTSQIEESLRFHINGYHLRQYIQSRQRWSDQVWQRVDFEAFGSFHRRLTSSEQIAHTKFLFDQWHTGKQRYKVATIKEAKLQLCPCCRTVIETPTHVIRCQQNPDHATALREFRRRMSPEEYHPVFQLLKDGVIAWIEDQEFHPMLTDFSGAISDSLRVALRDQTQIGWDNAIKGYLSVAWRDTAEKSLYGNSPDSQAGKGLHNVRVILRAMHLLTQQLWKSRNRVLHESNDKEHCEIRDTERAEICSLHAHPERVPAGDRHYCERPLSDILKMSPTSRRRWLRYMNMARARLTHEGKRQMLMTAFFRPVPKDR